MLTTIIVALITAVLGPIAVAWAKSKFALKKKSSIIATAIQSSNLVDSQLDTIMQETNADRVFVTQFHNGGHFYPTNKSIAKLSSINSDEEASVQFKGLIKMIRSKTFRNINEKISKTIEWLSERER